jgi:hypothetical protein
MGTFNDDQDAFFIIIHSFFLRMRNASDKCFGENQNTNFKFNNLFYWELCHLWDNVEKYCGAKQASYDNKGQDHCNCNCNCNLFVVHKSKLGYSPVDIDTLTYISSSIIYIVSG